MLEKAYLSSGKNDPTVPPHTVMDTRRLCKLAFAIQFGSFCLDSQHRVQSGDGGHGANASFDLDLSFFYLGLCDICLGRLDPAQFRHAGQLSAVGHHRRGRPVEDDHTGAVDAVRYPASASI